MSLKIDNFWATGWQGSGSSASITELDCLLSFVPKTLLRFCYLCRSVFVTVCSVFVTFVLRFRYLSLRFCYLSLRFCYLWRPSILYRNIERIEIHRNPACVCVCEPTGSQSSIRSQPKSYCNCRMFDCIANARIFASMEYPASSCGRGIVSAFQIHNTISMPTTFIATILLLTTLLCVLSRSLPSRISSVPQATASRSRSLSKPFPTMDCDSWLMGKLQAFIALFVSTHQQTHHSICNQLRVLGLRAKSLAPETNLRHFDDAVSENRPRAVRIFGVPILMALSFSGAWVVGTGPQWLADSAG